MVNLKPELQRTAECIPIERLGEQLTEAERVHLRTCARCEAEQELWRALDGAAPGADEGAAVQWIASELHRRRTPGRSSARPGWFASLGWRPLAGLAALVLAVGTGYLTWDPEPDLVAPVRGGQTYRTSAVTVIGPGGDVARAPSELAWMPVEGAATYDVRVLEVDQTLLWRASSETTRIELPRAVVDRIVPGKTLRWTVTAFDGSGRPIAESGMQSFRVPITDGPGRN